MTKTLGIFCIARMSRQDFLCIVCSAHAPARAADPASTGDSRQPDRSLRLVIGGADEAIGSRRSGDAGFGCDGVSAPIARRDRPGPGGGHVSVRDAGALALGRRNAELGLGRRGLHHGAWGRRKGRTAACRRNSSTTRGASA